MKLLIGFTAGLTIAVLLGWTADNDRFFVPSDPVELTYQQRELLEEQTVGKGIFTSTFSGITPSGNCYLAVTNTITGQTELIGIPEETINSITTAPLQPTEQGTAIIKLTQQ